MKIKYDWKKPHQHPEGPLWPSLNYSGTVQAQSMTTPGRHNCKFKQSWRCSRRKLSLVCGFGPAVGSPCLRESLPWDWPNIVLASMTTPTNLPPCIPSDPTETGLPKYLFSNFTSERGKEHPGVFMDLSLPWIPLKPRWQKEKYSSSNFGESWSNVLFNFRVLIYPPCNSVWILLFLFIKERKIIKVLSLSWKKFCLFPLPWSTSCHHLISQAG